MTRPLGVEIMKNESEKMVTARTAAVIAVLLMIVAFASWGMPSVSGNEAGGLIPPVASQQMGHPVIVGASHFVPLSGGAPKTKGQSVPSDGSLQVVDGDGSAGLFCPLKHTDVKAEISGF